MRNLLFFNKLEKRSTGYAPYGLQVEGVWLAGCYSYGDPPKSVVDVGWVSAQRVTQHDQDVGLRPTA